MCSATTICCSRVACPALGANSDPPHSGSRRRLRIRPHPRTTIPASTSRPGSRRAAIRSQIESRDAFLPPPLAARRCARGPRPRTVPAPLPEPALLSWPRSARVRWRPALWRSACGCAGSSDAAGCDPCESGDRAEHGGHGDRPEGTSGLASAALLAALASKTRTPPFARRARQGPCHLYGFETVSLPGPPSTISSPPYTSEPRRDSSAGRAAHS